MNTTGKNRDFYDRLGAFHEKLVEELAPQLIENPRLADALTEKFEKIREETTNANLNLEAPPDGGFSELIGIGPNAAPKISATHLPSDVDNYDEKVSSERILAIADLYYLYQIEMTGVFRAVQKLQQLFRAGTVRLSSGDGAYGLYRFDRRGRLRYTQKDRYQAYRRALGYTTIPPVKGAKPNSRFHTLFSHFINTVAQYWRDKRVSDVIRERAYDPSFGSVAMVRRAGLDLRNNLKWASYGHINVLRVEVMQLLNECFNILNARDIKRLFGAENAWDVVEEVMLRYHHKKVQASQRYRLATTGRNILRWLAIEHILKSSQTQFEALLQEIANDAEEWLTSADTLGIASRTRKKPTAISERHRRVKRIEQI